MPTSLLNNLAQILNQGLLLYGTVNDNLFIFFHFTISMVYCLEFIFVFHIFL